jgi:hypothetical protein
VTSLKQSLDNGSVAIGFSVGKQNIKVRNVLSISNEQAYQCVGSVCVMINPAYFVAFKNALAYFNNLAHLLSHLVLSSYIMTVVRYNIHRHLVSIDCLKNNQLKLMSNHTQMFLQPI